MAIKLVFKLKSDAKPYRSIIQLKKDIMNDNVLMPEMEVALKLLKKERKPFLNLALKYERILVPERSLTLQRALSPELKPFQPINWDKVYAQKYLENPESYQKRQIEVMEQWGFECVEKAEVSLTDIDAILASLQAVKK